MVVEVDAHPDVKPAMRIIEKENATVCDAKFFIDFPSFIFFEMLHIYLSKISASSK